MKRGHPPAATRVGRRRGGIRQAAAARARRGVESIVQPVNRIPTYALLDPDAEEAIHRASMRILEEIGVDFRGDPGGARAVARRRGGGRRRAGAHPRASWRWPGSRPPPPGSPSTRATPGGAW